MVIELDDEFVAVTDRVALLPASTVPKLRELVLRDKGFVGGWVEELSLKP